VLRETTAWSNTKQTPDGANRYRLRARTAKQLRGRD
jgi:hypothetical protein